MQVLAVLADMPRRHCAHTDQELIGHGHDAVHDRRQKPIGRDVLQHVDADGKVEVLGEVKLFEVPVQEERRPVAARIIQRGDRAAGDVHADIAVIVQVQPGRRLAAAEVHYRPPRLELRQCPVQRRLHGPIAVTVLEQPGVFLVLGLGVGAWHYRQCSTIQGCIG